jgi:Cytidylate kinase-like family
MGSGGSYTGYLTAKRLGFKYIDHEILRQAAERLRTDVGVLEPVDEKSSNLFQTIMKGFSLGTPEASFIPPDTRPLYSKDLFLVESKVIREIASRHNSVIMGRGGFHILKGHPGAIHVFVHAPEAFRVKRLMEAHGIKDLRTAETQVRESDRSRSRFIRDTTGVHWTDARNYHFCVDTSAVDFTTIVEMIVKLAGKKG